MSRCYLVLFGVVPVLLSLVLGPTVLLLPSFFSLYLLPYLASLLLVSRLRGSCITIFAFSYSSSRPLSLFSSLHLLCIPLLPMLPLLSALPPSLLLSLHLSRSLLLPQSPRFLPLVSIFLLFPYFILVLPSLASPFHKFLLPTCT